MKPILKQYGTLIMSIVAAAAIILTALLTKGTEHQNAWFYVFCIWCILFAVCEMYSKKK